MPTHHELYHERESTNTNLSIEPEPIGLEDGAGGDGGGGGQMLRVERDADAGIDGQDELLVALAPVLDDGDVAGRAGRLHHHPCLPFLPHRQCHCETEKPRRVRSGRGEAKVESPSLRE